ncbi:hypothetical protein AVEN_108936-1 [Araneus ventricosus]|uniref:Uncharacterized protein n=1 Tax=Araneus ventricosus TaxID=182803 RepID=A0A4Y2ESY2_ARAVE|nr:hypothetical protein AVEN_108936-1 [Araneus ventricosus]
MPHLLLQFVETISITLRTSVGANSPRAIIVSRHWKPFGIRLGLQSCWRLPRKDELYSNTSPKLTANPFCSPKNWQDSVRSHNSTPIKNATTISQGFPIVVDGKWREGTERPLRRCRQNLRDVDEMENLGARGKTTTANGLMSLDVPEFCHAIDSRRFMSMGKWAAHLDSEASRRSLSPMARDLNREIRSLHYPTCFSRFE